MPFGPIVNFIMTFVCFGTPYAYLRHINEKFFASAPGRTDTIIERWQNFVDENVSDWTNTNLVVRILRHVRIECALTGKPAGNCVGQRVCRAACRPRHRSIHSSARHNLDTLLHCKYYHRVTQCLAAPTQVEAWCCDWCHRETTSIFHKHPYSTCSLLV